MDEEIPLSLQGPGRPWMVQVQPETQDLVHPGQRTHLSNLDPDRHWERIHAAVAHQEPVQVQACVLVQRNYGGQQTPQMDFMDNPRASDDLKELDPWSDTFISPGRMLDPSNGISGGKRADVEDRRISKNKFLKKRRM